MTKTESLDGNSDKEKLDQYLLMHSDDALQSFMADNGLSNSREFEFSKLLIQIAFASVGLASIYLGEPMETIEKWSIKIGIMFFVASIVAGGIQLWSDREFFHKYAEKARCYSESLRSFWMKKSNDNYKAINDNVDGFNDLPKTGNTFCIFLQVMFVSIGAFLILKVLLFR